MAGRAQVIQSLLDLYGTPSYLEVGVQRGHTFHEIRAAKKVAVDPKFLFPPDAREPSSEYNEVTSDEYFFSLNEDANKFDVIFLDGLHTFEQTLRDLNSAVLHLSPKGIIIIDDVIPSSYHASLPDIPEFQQVWSVTQGSVDWMGDVYKLVFFVATFWPDFSFATTVDNHGQMIMWRQRREHVPNRTVRQISELEYKHVVLLRQEYNPLTGSQILALIKEHLFCDTSESHSFDLFRGFLKCADAEPSIAALPLIAAGVPNKEHEQTNERSSVIPAQGCHFYNCATVQGCGYILVDGKLHLEDVQSSDVSAKWFETARKPTKNVRCDDPCISFVGPGHRIYGHWLVEFIPRLAVAVKTLGERIKDFSLLLPADTPSFVKQLLDALFPIDFRIISYTEEDAVYCSKLAVPTFPLSRDSHFHSLVADLYRPHQAQSLGRRKLFISRAKIEGRSFGFQKVFGQTQFLEETASRFGYEVVYPEQLDIPAQMNLFREAAVLMGVYGSGLHNSLFCAEGAIVGSAGLFNAVQLRLCAMMRQRACVISTQNQHIDAGRMIFDCDVGDIVSAFKAIEANLKAAR